jgi:uncharacterized protein (DUF1778 family)
VSPEEVPLWRLASQDFRKGKFVPMKTPYVYVDARRVSLELAGHWPYTFGWRQIMPKAASKPARGRIRSQRLEARVTAAQKTLIERAAALQGRTVTDFVLTSVQDAARRAITEHQQIELSVRDSQAFVEALLNPKPINDRLRETVRRYREATGV